VAVVEVDKLVNATRPPRRMLAMPCRSRRVCTTNAPAETTRLDH